MEPDGNLFKKNYKGSRIKIQKWSEASWASSAKLIWSYSIRSDQEAQSRSRKIWVIIVDNIRSDHRQRKKTREIISEGNEQIVLKRSGGKWRKMSQSGVEKSYHSGEEGYICEIEDSIRVRRA